MGALVPADGPAARGLVNALLGGTPYLSRALEQLEIALGGGDAECRGVIAAGSGFLLYGEVGGADGVIKVHWLIGDVGACVEELPPARLMVAEVSEDPIFAPAISALTAGGFVIEGGVDGYFSDRVGLTLLVKR